MIAYEILKKKPVISVPTHGTPYHQRAGLFERRRLERLNQQPVIDLQAIPRQEVPNRMPFTDELVTELRTNGEFKANPPGISPVAMGKIQYARWLTAHVYPDFPVLTRVTFKTIPIVLNAAPKVWFNVVNIQEMHYWVEMDKETREPKAVGIALDGHKYPTYYPPSVLRTLVNSEIEAIDQLRNQARGERNNEATGDTSIVSIDRSTGEITYEES